MKKTRMFRRFLLAAIPLAFAAPAWAIIIPACPGAPTALSPAFTNSTGCQAGNVQFNNFVVGPDATGMIGTVTLSPTTWPTPPDATSIDLNAVPGGGIELTSLGTCGTPTSGITPKTFCIGGGPAPGVGYALVSSTYYEMTATAGSISQLELDATVFTHASGASGANAFAFREFCLGDTSFDCTSASANYRELQVGILNGKFQTLSGNSSISFAGVQNIGVRDTIFLQTFGPTGEYAGITSLELFTPEPATFGLVGLALAGLGALRIRKRKV